MLTEIFTQLKQDLCSKDCVDVGKAAMQKDDTLEIMTHERFLSLDLFNNVFK